MSFFFFNDTATTEIYTLSLHDALPISRQLAEGGQADAGPMPAGAGRLAVAQGAQAVAVGDQVDVVDPAARRADRKSTRLNSSHANISYAVFCLKKKKHISHMQSLSTHI